jgi:hypothetical protein
VTDASHVAACHFVEEMTKVRPADLRAAAQ